MIKYISVDVETTGSVPGTYSMIALGACVVGDTDKQFYRELKPINHDYVTEAMKVACLGLHCLEPYMQLNKFNPKSENFESRLVMDLLFLEGEEPEDTMNDFANWISEVSDGAKIKEAAAPIKFDGSFTAYYFENFYNGKNPLGFSGEDINSMYRGVMRNTSAHIRDLGFRDSGLPHNALEDAIIQAKEMEEVLRRMVVK